ncbi:MAG: hypothetical protein ACFFAD_08270 [Candidatus Hermodarchaeota archaeon]
MNWRKIGAISGILAGLQFVVLSFVDMLIYPGGYNFFENYFSQLGLAVINSVDTPVNWFLFATATTLGGIFTVPFYLSIRTVFTETRMQKALSGLGTALGVVAAPCLAGIGIFAADLFLFEHAWSTIIFFVLTAIAIATYSIAILLKSDYQNLYSLVGIIVAIICLLHIYGPGFGTAIMQKAAVYALVSWSAFQGYELRKMVQ